MRKARQNFLPQIVCANVNVDFAFRGSAQIARTDDLPLLDKDHGVASDFDFTEQVRIEENRGAALAFVADDVAHEVAAHGIQAGSGLVEKDQVGLMNKGLGEADPLHHAFGEAPEAAITMRGEANQIKIRWNAIPQLQRSETAEPAVKRQEFLEE